jgi:hypothetical protein
VESGAQPGNTNGVKGALFNSALKRALARSSKTVDGGLNNVCAKLVEAALNGEQWAIKEVADRIDGRPAQSIDVDANIKTYDVTEVLLGDLSVDSDS